MAGLLGMLSLASVGYGARQGFPLQKPQLQSELRSLPPDAPCKDLLSSTVGKLSGYLVEFPDSPNVPRLRCDLGASITPLNLEASAKSTEDDWKRWEAEGLIAADQNLGGWNREPLKAASVFMSHANIWRQHAASSEEWAGVFEGDAVLSDDFHEVFANLTSKFRKGEMPETDIVYLGHCLNTDCASNALVTLPGNVSVVRSAAPVCSHAYLLSRRGAQILLDHAFPIRDNNDRVPMKSLIEEGKLKSLSLCPTIARQGSRSWTCLDGGHCFDVVASSWSSVFMMWAYHHKRLIFNIIPVLVFFAITAALAVRLRVKQTTST